MKPSTNTKIDFNPSYDENKLVIIFLLCSILLHIGVFLIKEFELLKPAPMPINEWSIGAELVADIPNDLSDKNRLPNAQKSKQAAVPSKILPQLPKKFALKHQTPEDEGLLEEQKDAKKAGLDKKREKDDLLIQAKSDDKASNLLAQKEALKRLAMERIRREQNKKAQELKTQEESRDIISAIGKLMGDASPQKAAKFSAYFEGLKYGKILKRSIKRHYSLPQTFRSKVVNPEVILAIRINVRGELISVEIHRSSNDRVFDDYTVKAAKSAAPYERPPKVWAGKLIFLAFRR